MTTELVLPLDAVEIKQGIVHKILEVVDQRIADAIMESMGKNCRLYGASYPKFSAKWKIEVELEDFGRTFEANVGGSLPVQELAPEVGQYRDGAEHIEQSVEIAVSGVILETPPNVFRAETGQEVPKVTNPAPSDRAHFGRAPRKSNWKSVND